jgi:serine/threonine-protein kinase
MSLSPLQPGTRLGKYEVLAHVASGGMAAVYKAVDPGLRRTVALKVLPPFLAKRDADLERFRREARLAARLSHKNIVTLFEYQYDTELDLHYLVMEFVEGIDLAQHIERKGQLPPEDARRILIQAGRALEHAFSRGVIHRDVKPSNFLLAQAGQKLIVKLTDLGLALVQGEDDFKVTRAGSTVGTVDYMAPEQARDSRATDIRSDIYALGCTGFHMLAGRPPFDGGLGERVFKHLQEAPPDVREFSPTVSADFWAVLQKMLAKDPEERYATPTELLDALNRTPARSTDEPATEPPATPTGKRRRKTDVSASPPPMPSTVEEPQAALPEPAKPASDRDTRASSPEPTPAPAPPPDQAPQPLVTPEQARTAAAFYQRALQVMAEGGGDEYVRQLLDNCLKQDPVNLTYHKTLREVTRKTSSGVLRRLFGSLNVLVTKSKMRMARSSGDIRKVMELGTKMLDNQPSDVDAYVEMAGAASDAAQHDLAIWFLDLAREYEPDSVTLLKALAEQYEKIQDYKRAIALWEKVRRRDPDDNDVRRKIDQLSVDDHIKGRHYRRSGSQ